MRLLLACVLALLPLTAQAEYTDNQSTKELNPSPVTDPFIAESPKDPDSPLNEWGPYGNPYSPISATNFEAIPAPFLYDPDRLNAQVYNPDWLSSPFGHYGNPYSPNQFKDR
jgi:hypothetical protein